MSRDEAELEAQRVAQVRMAITKLLEQKQGRRNLSLSEMERLVGEMDSDLRQAVMETLVEESQTQGQGLCPTCGGKVRHKGKRRKQVVTVRGEVVVERDYCLCSACGAGYFPPR
jgi:YgiT-type zinc finger domain-containing protein